MNEYKIGDAFICIKTTYLADDEDEAELLFIEGKEYRIIDIVEQRYDVSSKYKFFTEVGPMCPDKSRFGSSIVYRDE